MSAGTWEDASYRFTSGVHANGEWRSATGGGLAKPFIRKAVEPVKRESHAKRRCDSCGFVPNMLGECANC